MLHTITQRFNKNVGFDTATTFHSKLSAMKIITLTPPLLVILATLMFNSANAQCDSDQSNAHWYISSSNGSHKITICDNRAIYNCHGFVLSYFENSCTPGITQTITAPYMCPATQGNQGSIATNVKFVEVCNVSQCDAVWYSLYGGTSHSAVRVEESGQVKYISKYGDDGPLVSHDLNGSFYHYSPNWSVTSTNYYVYVGNISGNPNIVGTGNVSFSVNNKSGVTYSWSIISGGSYIYISSASNQNTVTLKPTHSGTAVLKLITDSSCGSPRTQTINLNIDTQICLEGTYTNAGQGPYNLNTGNSVSTGSVMTNVTCPDAASYTWQRTSGSLSYYASGPDMSFTMTSGSSISFLITAKNSSNQVIGTRNVSYYNYGSYMAYPNPTTSSFEIDVIEGVELDIVVFDENKQKLKEIKGYKAKSKVDVSKWKRGNYFLHIYQDSKHVKEQRIKIDD